MTGPAEADGFAGDFAGCKLALFIGPQILTVLRDDKPDIPYPGYWDFPGGGRDPGETPEDCILRETYEEVSLQLAPSALTRVARYPRPIGPCWFFAAHLDVSAEAGIVLGDEGQTWQLMAPQAYAAHKLRIPHFADWMLSYLEGNAAQ